MHEYFAISVHFVVFYTVFNQKPWHFATFKRKYIISKAKRWFPMLEARLQMEDLCKKIGFTVEQVRVLLTGKALNFSGSLYSEEYRRKFNVVNAEIKIFSDSTKPNQLFLFK